MATHADVTDADADIAAAEALYKPRDEPPVLKNRTLPYLTRGSNSLAVPSPVVRVAS